MLNKNDFKYILKKIIIFFIIFLIFMLLGSCSANADVLPKPSQANLQMNDNGTTRYLTNTNINSYTSVYVDGEQKRFYTLIESSHVNVSTITHVNVTYNPRLTGPIYSEFLFYMSGINVNGNPYLKLTNLYSYDDTTHNYNLCDIDFTKSVVTGYVYKMRCYSTEAIQQLSFNFTCYDPNNNCNTTSPDIEFAIEEFGYYTQNMQDAATIQAISDLQQEIINNQINNNSQDINSSDFLANLTAITNSYNLSNNVITQLVLMPITLLNKYYVGWSTTTCVNYNLGSLYGTPLILPCIRPENYLGSSLWSVIDFLMSGFLIFTISKKMVNVFDDLTNLRSNQVDELYGGGA